MFPNNFENWRPQTTPITSARADNIAAVPACSGVTCLGI